MTKGERSTITFCCLTTRKDEINGVCAQPTLLSSDLEVRDLQPLRPSASMDECSIGSGLRRPGPPSFPQSDLLQWRRREGKRSTQSSSTPEPGQGYPKCH